MNRVILAFCAPLIAGNKTQRPNRGEIRTANTSLEMIPNPGTSACTAAGQRLSASQGALPPTFLHMRPPRAELAQHVPGDHPLQPRAATSRPHSDLLAGSLPVVGGSEASYREGASGPTLHMAPPGLPPREHPRKGQLGPEQRKELAPETEVGKVQGEGTHP